jgi:transposase
MKHKAITRRVLSIDTSNQLSLLGETRTATAIGEATPKRGGAAAIRFEEPDPKRIFINQVRLDDHLKRMELSAPFKVRALLDKVSFDAFKNAYKAGGRPPYAPRLMLGLILYGIMQGISSLRDLERMAKIDVGAWWISGGIVPDHSIIGRFIQMHDALLTTEFFNAMLKEVLRATGTKTAVAAGDGTIIEAAASRYGLLRQEALQEALATAREQAKTKADEASEAKVTQLEKAEAALNARQVERAARGKDPKTLLIHPLEPEAVVQPQKDKKQFRPSYKPQVLANEARIIVACDVHPSSETVLLPQLLDSAGAHGPIQTALLDAGFFSAGVLQSMAARQIELLCPEGRSEGADWNKQSDKQFPKSQFSYEAAQDHYRCPAGQLLRPVEFYRGSTSEPAHVQYGTTACGDCPMRDRCTTSKTGRRIKRYAIDEAKDALRAKMTESEVRARYLKRQAMVEPVFSQLRGRQGLKRFRRSGLAAVRREFALHAMAYNLSRVVARCRLIWRLIWRHCAFTFALRQHQNADAIFYRHLASSTSQ